jgi:hypothetical protein
VGFVDFLELECVKLQSVTETEAGGSESESESEMDYYLIEKVCYCLSLLTQIQMTCSLSNCYCYYGCYYEIEECCCVSNCALRLVSSLRQSLSQKVTREEGLNPSSERRRYCCCCWYASSCCGLERSSNLF